jgi:hypothetical protein
MERLDQLAQWRTELKELQAQFRGSVHPSRGNAEDVFRACIASLDRDRRETVQLQRRSFRRSVDLIARPYVETDAFCIIRRTNKALQSWTCLSPDQGLVGTPFLLLIAKEDRDRFVEEFLKLARGDSFFVTQLILRIQPRPGAAGWAEFHGHRVDGPNRTLLGVVWLLKQSDPA